MVTEEILAEAKRKYPIGTYFRPAHVSKGLCRVISHSNSYQDGGYISFTSEKIEQDFEPVVYDNGKWATIISLPVKKTFDIW